MKIMRDLQKIIDTHVDKYLYPGVAMENKLWKKNIFKGKSGHLNINNKEPSY